jgi:putative cardiolipin synthase
MNATRINVAASGLTSVLAILCLGTSAYADTACLLDTEWSAAVERARLVLEAERTIDVSTFIVGNDPFSLTSMSLLRDAARRGIRVRLLVDAQWNKLPREVEAHLLASGIEIRHFHPFRFNHPFWLTRRMHDKLVVVDEASLIAGGRNIESPYFGLGEQLKRRNYIDADVLVTGDSAAEAGAYFEEIWNSSAVRPLRRRSRSWFTAAQAEETLDTHFAWLEDRVDGVRGTAEATPPATCQEVGPVSFIHDPPGKKGKGRGVADALLELFDGAQQRVIIESPYLVLTKNLKAGILRARARGVEIRILTNSLYSTDNIWPQAGYVGKRRWLAQQGVELWEYYGPESMHAKTAVLDDSLAVVGSFNLDPRSTRLNTELAIVIDDALWATALEATMDEHLLNSARIGADGRPIGYDERYPKASWGKKCKLRLMRIFAPLIRGQL